MQTNYSFNTTVQHSDDSKSLFAITPHYAIESISDQHIFLIHTKHQKTLLLESYLIPVIDALSSFKSLGEHIAYIDKLMRLEGKGNDDISHLIKHLLDNGFIINTDFAKEALTHTSDKPIEEPPIVVVRTAGRVVMLKRFIQSAIENEATYNARYQYLFIDDSSPELAEANALNIKASGLNARHIDKAAQSNLLSKFKTSFPDNHHQLDFLLGQSVLHELDKPYGRTWNWGILLSAGKPVVFLDDDCLLNTYQSPLPPKANNHAVFKNTNKEIVFLDKDKSIGSQLNPVKLDPIANLASVLGLGPDKLNITSESFKDSNTALLNNNKPSNIIISTQGIAGEPGSASANWLYHLDNQSVTNFIGKDEATYQQNKRSRFAWVGYPNPRISFGHSHSTVARAMDNRQLLPATLPIFRNEDALFTHFVSYLYPQHASYEHSWAIAHLPEIERKWSDEYLMNPVGFDLIGALNAMMLENKRLAGNNSLDAKDKLTQFGDQLNALAKYEESSFIHWLYTEQQSNRASQLRGLDESLQTNPQAPNYWQQDVHQQIKINSAPEQTLQLGNQSPKDIQAVIKSYAESLKIWPELWLFCKENNHNL